MERSTPEQDEIVNLLRETAPNIMVSGEIAAKLGRTSQSVSNALKKLRAKGRVVSAGWGKWTIPSDSEHDDSKF